MFTHTEKIGSPKALLLITLIILLFVPKACSSKILSLEVAPSQTVTNDLVTMGHCDHQRSHFSRIRYEHVSILKLTQNRSYINFDH